MNSTGKNFGWMSGIIVVSSLWAGCNLDRLSPAGRADRELLLMSTSNERAVDITVSDPREVDLVEAVVQHRRDYGDNLKRLREYYAAHGFATKLSWADAELEAYYRIQPFRYLLDAEVPRSELHAQERIPEADSLYEQALQTMKEGGHNVPVFYRQSKMLETANKLREIIVKYPGSDKIDDAAFLLGEIHKDYLPDQETIAVEWYERAWTWDPNTPYPARFQAATVYDYRLHDRDRALELYKEVVTQEANHRANYQRAQRRVEQLTSAGRN